jgi:PAN domain
LVGERARREGVERRDKTLQAQIAKEAQAHQDLKREFDKSLDEVATAKANVVELSQRLNEANAQVSSSARRIEVAKSAARAALFTQNPIMQFGSIAAVVATVGFWTYHLVGSAPTGSERGSVQEAALLPVAVTDEARRKVEEAEQFRKEAERQANLAADADAKRQAAEAEQQRLKDQLQRQAKAAADADSKRQAAEAEQQRLKVEVQRQTTAAADADTKRRAAEAEQQRLKDEVQRLTKAAPAALPQPIPTATASSFESRPNMEGAGPFATWAYAQTGGNCEAECTQRSTCVAFTFVKSVSVCRLYDQVPSFTRNVGSDSGVRQSMQPATQSNTSVKPVALPPASRTNFERRTKMVAKGVPFQNASGSSAEECEAKCSLIEQCAAVSYSSDYRFCGLYSSSDLTPSLGWDTSIRK